MLWCIPTLASVFASPAQANPSPHPAARPAPTSVRAVGRSIVAPSRARVAQRRPYLALGGDGFSAASTTPNAWVALGGACLTAGNAATPPTSIPACGANAPLDAPGQGALQLTNASGSAGGLVVTTAPISTMNGLAITFTDYAFGGSGGDGLAFFLTDGSQPPPSVAGALDGSLGYANDATTAGIGNAFVGIGFDEYGLFSSPTSGRIGGPGLIPETIAVRGSASNGYAYLGGATSAAGQAASLPFPLDQPAATTRPANAPTIQITLSVGGILSVAIDRHDGNGFVQYYTGNVTSAGQPALPASVYLGFSATTGSASNCHQVGGFAVSSLDPVGSFAPTQIPNLAAWFDASAPSSVALRSGFVSTWNDLSGNGNAVTQATHGLQPSFVAGGINGLGSVAFTSHPYLLGTKTTFSASLLNESSVFVVSNQKNATQASAVLASGPFNTSPHWVLQLSDGGTSIFDFNNKKTGRLTPQDVPNGPAVWSALGSVSGKAQIIRKDGNTLSAGGGPAVTVNPAYRLAIGAVAASGAPSYQYNGQLGEVVIFNRLLSSAEAAQVEGYLACKWGLQNRLPANHPYRNVCPQGGTHPSLPLAPPSTNALSDPPQLRSRNGQLVFNVVATADANGNPLLSYNGSTQPPTLRVLPGDTLIVNLTNELPVPPAGAGYLNDTNLHYHGLHVTPNAPGDDSIDMMAMPGQSLHYQIVIPVNHPTGLYWYHSHAHGEAERQNLNGMSGALIVDGIAASAPTVANLAERVLVVRDALPAGQPLPLAGAKQVQAMFWAARHATVPPRSPAGMSGMSAMSGMSMQTPVRGSTTARTRNPYVVVDPRYRAFIRPRADTHCLPGNPETAAKVWTLNGQTMPSIGIRPGEKQFWRLVNAGSDTYLDLQVDNTTMQVVALDGVPLAGAGLSVAHYVVPPASRIEFVVTGPPAGTTAYLRTNCFDAGQAGPAMPAATLAVLDPTTSPSDQLRHRQRSSPGATYGRALHGTAYMRAFVHRYGIARTQTLTYSSQNTINGSSYDPAAPAQFYAQSGTMEQWQIVNVSSQVHTFHIHQLHFLVNAIVGGTAIEQQNVGQVIDNINVPAATANGPGSVTVTLDFSDPAIVGTFLLHCHILSHEDAGMMAAIHVGLAPPMTTTVPPVGLQFASASAASQTFTFAGGQAPYSITGCAGVANAALSGNGVTVAPAGAGACVLTIADATGLSASVAVTVALVSPIVLSPSTLAFTSPTAAAQSTSIVGGVPPYSVTGCAGIATTAISGSVVTVAPTAPGTCSDTILDAANDTQTIAVSINTFGGGTLADNLTFHQNPSRQGWYQAETALTTSSVASTSFGFLGSLSAPAGSPAFGKVYAQPLYVSNENVAGTPHNLVIVSTSTDQIYAFDDVTGTVVWNANFTAPAKGITQQSWHDTNCADVNPDIGITGTPVIDRIADLLYVVVPTKENGVFHLRLHAISLQNGLDAVPPVEVSASVQTATGGTASTSAEFNFNRSALLEANGNIYVALGSHCDFNTPVTHGWMLAYSAANLAPAGNAVDVTNASTGGNYYLGSPWMGGYGPAADASGNIYFATGNGPWDGVNNFSMSVLEVPGNLNVGAAQYFTPATELQDSNADQDLGSGGVMLLPDGTSPKFPHLLIAGGKNGATGSQKYLLNRDNLGGQQPGDAGAVWHANTGGEIWGGPAYFADAAGNTYVIYGTGMPLNTYLFAPASNSFSVLGSAYVGCLECRDAGSQPVVSSNGTTSGTAVVWALRTPGNSGGTISLLAFDPMTMTPLYQGVAGSWLQSPGASYIGGALVSPLVANGRVYVPTDGAVAVFGLAHTAPTHHARLRGAGR